MKWFQHQSNASMNSKLQEVLLDYGLEGYGLYWYCLELVAVNVDGHKLNFELEHDARVIARNTGSTVQKVEEMMKRFIELNLFEQSEGVITCLKLAKRCDEYTNKLIRNKGLVKCPDTVGTKSALIDKNKVKESKVNNTNTSVAIAPVKQAKTPACPYSEIANIYNECINQPFPKVRAITTDKRKRLTRKFYSLMNNDLDKIRQYFTYFNQKAGPFYRAETGGNWVADFEYIVKEDTIEKARENRL